MNPVRALLDSGSRGYTTIVRGEMLMEHDLLNQPYPCGETPLSHALRLLVEAYVNERSLYWPHAVACRLLQLGARRLSVPEMGAPWCALLTLLFDHPRTAEATNRLCFYADIDGRCSFRSMHTAHWTHLLRLLDAMRTPHRAEAPYALLRVWRTRVLYDLLELEHSNACALRILLRMLLLEMLPLRGDAERACLTTLLSDTLQALRAIQRPGLTEMEAHIECIRWGALGEAPQCPSEAAYARIKAAQPHSEQRTRLVALALDKLPGDLRAHVARMHNRSLLLPDSPHEHAWDLRLCLCERTLAAP